MPHLNVLDRFIGEVDKGLKTLMPSSPRQTNRPMPAKATMDSVCLTAHEKKHVAGLMRVNHAGEICAQALYQGQALSAKLPEIRDQMNLAAQEEIDHLAWCEQRLTELGSQPSRLNTIWYLGSLAMGTFAGALGDRWSLGFVAETEHQVSAHLEQHIRHLPQEDERSRQLLEQMHIDEAKHAEMAEEAGAAQLPVFIQKIMGLASKMMTKTSYYI